MSKFDPWLYSVKALLLTDDDSTKIIKGWLTMRWGKVRHVTDDGELFREVNPYGICRCTGIKVNGEYLYEYDLITFNADLSSKTRMGYIFFDDFSNSWAVRTSFNYSSTRQLRQCVSVKVIGNINLVDADADMFQAYSDKEEQDYQPNTEPECRSKQHINKKMREFLPR